MNRNANLIPEITDADIHWIADQLRLTLDDERTTFLKCRTSIDVAACPGSGKTTLVVAKLAILAKKWPYRTKGICVLSHTNVARDEIEARLVGILGNSLFGYPHFIGTIHAFANRFLAIPYLRSQGCTEITVDDALTHEYRKRALGHSFHGLESFLKQKFCSFEGLRLKDSDCGFCIKGKNFPAGSHTTSYKSAQRAVNASAQKGYFCFDEMFIWAKALLSQYPLICNGIAERFPFVIIDEVQDTNKQQGILLRKIFQQSSMPIMQRVGDANQAIYNYAGDIEDTELAFPQSGYHTIAKSFRFGQKIADLAAPVAATPILPTFVGAGPQRQDCITEGKHTVFIFPQADTSNVLQAFGELVLDTFEDDLLQSKHRVAAVGGVHRRNDDAVPPEHFPKSVCDYWDGYSPDNSLRKEHPTSLLQYFFSGQQILHVSDCLAPAVNKIATGILRLAKLSGNSIGSSSNAHRLLVSLLSESQDGKQYIQRYQGLLDDILLRHADIHEEAWNCLKKELGEIFNHIFPAQLDFAASSAFLKWQPSTPIQINDQQERTKLNIYVAKKNGREVDIHLDSIHGVKGQTHLATLVVDTFNRTHFFKQILNPLIGKTINSTDATRLRLAYVAMTRPTHLLCLAIPDSSLGAKNNADKNMLLLEKMGWTIQKL